MGPVTDGQVRRLMEELNKHNKVGYAAMKSGMDRKTARKYINAGAPPSQLSMQRSWVTRANPFTADWGMMVAWLVATPGLDAKTVFEMLLDERPGVYQASQLRTLQRKVRTWRALQGPERDVMFGQAHRPGEAAQTDFTWANELNIVIASEAFHHMLCVFVLPYSNWQWVTVCLSESLMALRRGVQAALFNLSRVPEFHQTDNSTAATHNIPKGSEEHLVGHKRPFNTDYLALMRHFGMKPRTTEVGAKEQNGDVEASNNAIKHRLDQALLRRGNRDFPSVQAWQQFIDGVVRKANATRSERVTKELAVMAPLEMARLPEYQETRVRVASWGTIRVKNCAYSVPSRLKSQWVQARVYEDRLEVYFNDVLQLTCERLRAGDKRHRIDYRHVIWSLVRKPGAFARYVYREEMFPSDAFRRAYDAINARDAGLSGDLEYLRILHLAASESEADVQAALELLLANSAVVITSDTVKGLVHARGPAVAPEIVCDAVDLHDYDTLLKEVNL